MDDFGLAQLAGQLKRHVAAERKANEEDGQPAILAPQVLQKYGEIGSEPRVVKSLAELGGAAASSHVKTVRDKAVMQRCPRHAADVSGFSTALETMQENDLSNGRIS